MGVGGILSKAEEKIPNNDDEECAKLKLANDKNEGFRVIPKFDTLNPELFFRSGVMM